VCHLRHALWDLLFRPTLLFDSLSDANAAGPIYHQGESPLVELGNKVRSETAEDEHCRRKKRDRAQQNQPSHSQRETQSWRIKLFNKSNDEIVAFRNVGPE